jgi:hypothetical protein
MDGLDIAKHYAKPELKRQESDIGCLAFSDEK